MKKVLIGIAIVVVAVAILAVGCKKQEGGGSESGKKTYRIAVIPKGTTHVFWKSIHAGALKAAQELKAAGIDVEVIWKGPLKEDDRESQIRVVEDFVTRGVTGIVLAPLDDTALRTPVKDAVNRSVAQLTQLTMGQSGKTVRGELNAVAWATVSRPGDYVKPHIHPLSTWSGVYFVSGEDNTDALFFVGQKDIH